MKTKECKPDFNWSALVHVMVPKLGTIQLAHFRTPISSYCWRLHVKTVLLTRVVNRTGVPTSSSSAGVLLPRSENTYSVSTCFRYHRIIS